MEKMEQRRGLKEESRVNIWGNLSVSTFEKLLTLVGVKPWISNFEDKVLN